MNRTLRSKDCTTLMFLLANAVADPVTKDAAESTLWKSEPTSPLVAASCELLKGAWSVDNDCK